MEKILISSCFLGENVRYNAEIKVFIHPLITLWQQQKRLISICPETSGGLNTPREPAEIQQQGLIITRSGTDVSQAFKCGAEQALKLCKQHQIKLALLKESSPSCGSSTIYDGSFSHKKIAGEGITTRLLRQHNIQVFSENSIELLAQQLNK
jgi:uncharacterized protein YbbK (DUF523 family)